MKNLPVGRQNFEAIIEENLLYVDKTRQVYELIRSGRLYFLSRPRRFGKSLLVSLFAHLFQGKKSLFEHLYIGKAAKYEWTEYPVLQFNMAAFGHEVENLEAELSFQLRTYARQFDVEISELSLSSRFRTLVSGIASQGRPVVILIDEYDKPIVDFLGDMDKARSNQKVLKDFFSPLKDMEAQGHLRFLFITGVSKFSKVSLFSDLNNLTDLSMHPLSADLLGITQEELLEYFQDYLPVAAAHLDMTEATLLEGIKTWYNGYSYNGQTRLYNPFSILGFFQNYHFGNYWFSSGTPTFLVNTIRDRGVPPQSIERIEVNETFFDKFSLEDLDVGALLFQTGYLTIKDVAREGFDTRYTLGYPNLEVRRSMMHNLAEAFTCKSASVISQALLLMQDGLRKGNPGLFVDQLRTVLADISYHWMPKANETEAYKMWEGYFHTIVYLLISYMQVQVRAELTRHKGRIDLLAETDKYLYLMEFKLDETAGNALEQIKQREYALAYKRFPKTVLLVGITFSSSERNVAQWEAEVWD